MSLSHHIKHWDFVPIDVMMKVLEENDFNVIKTAEILNIETATIYNKCRKYNLTLPGPGRHSKFSISTLDMLDALVETGGVVTRASKLLNCGHKTITRRMRLDDEFSNKVYQIRVAHKQGKKDAFNKVMDDIDSTIEKQDSDNMFKGYLYESLWDVECYRRELLAHRVPMPRPGHDNITFSMKSGNMYRVQIKGVGYRAKKNQAYMVKLSRRIANKFLYGNGKRKPVNAARLAKIDIIAVYVSPFSTWYLIPIRALTSRVIAIYPQKPNSKAKHEQYKENWSCFK